MKTLLIDAICGVGFPSIVVAVECAEQGLAHFTGNQHNPDWAWNRKALEECSEETLQELYSGLRSVRESMTHFGEPEQSEQSRIVVCP